MIRGTRRLDGKGRRPSVIFLPCYRDQRMLNGVCQFACEAGWVLDTLYFHNGILPRNWSGDGILCLLELREVDPAAPRFVMAHRGVPVVDLSGNEPSVPACRILQDNRAIGRMGAEHLASIGCVQVGFAIQDRNNFHCERYEGFQARAEELGLAVARIQVPRDFALSQRTTAWFTHHVPKQAAPFGVMAAADYIAQWILKVCQSARKSVPEEVAIIGVDNSREICDLAPVSLSSIDNNAFQHGYEGAKLLHGLMAGRRAPSRPVIVPPGALHVRESTDVVAARHPHVAAAMRHLAQHFTEPQLTSAHVAAQVPMSKRRLNDAFMKYTGRTICQELAHRRLQHALKRIQTTDEKLWVIAEQSGFHSAEVMSRLFHRQLGHWPSTYRHPESGG